MKLLRVHKKKKLWLLSTPRTGSHYLSTILNECLGYHAIDEWLGIHTAWYKGEKKIEACDIPDYVNLHWHQCRRVFGQTNLDFIKQIAPDVKFVVMKRKDIIAQTASYYVAFKSKVWRLRNDNQLNIYRRRDIPIKDNEIIKSYEDIRSWSNAWSDFVDNGHTCCYYEDLYSNPYPIVESIIGLLGLNCDIERAITTVQKNFKRTYRKETEQVKNRLKEILSLSDLN